jgi:hypothetical protein
VLPLHLRDKSLAFIAEADFYERGRNFISNSILIRPNIQEVRVIELGSKISVHDLNHDGISEVILVGVGSGQGRTHYRQSLVQFNGWKPVVMHSVDYGNNDGVCADTPITEAGIGICVSSDVVWGLEDLNGDGVDELVEVITNKRGHRSKIKKNYFVFEGSRLVAQTQKMP